MSWAKFGDLLRHIWMPYLVIAVTGTAGLFKTFRANLLDEIGQTLCAPRREPRAYPIFAC